MTERDQPEGPSLESAFAALGERLRDVRVLKRMSQAEVASRAGISRSRLSQLESGEQLSVETLFRLARALDVHPADLLDDRDDGALLVRLRQQRGHNH